MRITFQAGFRTRLGQSLWLTGEHELLGGGDPEKALPLEYFNEHAWRVTLVVPRSTAPDANIIYNYVLREADGTNIVDWGTDRFFNPARMAAEEVLFIDAWNDAGSFENAFFTEPFQDVLLKSKQTEVRAATPEKVTHVFRVKAPLLEKGQTLCLLGDSSLLGNWNALAPNPVLLSRVPGEDVLSAELDLSGATFPIAYKYGVFDLERKAFVRYEDGSNRTLPDVIRPNKRTVVNDGLAALPANTWRGAGVAIPVFSLRSEQSFGIGEFSDLKLLADWAQKVGLKLIQVLPVNDTTATHTWKDSYPYSAISAFALHPIYLNLEAAASNANKRLLKALEEERKRLNSLPALDYEAVVKAKMGFLKQIYASQKEQTFRSKEYKKFFEQNRHWLEPYAAFCYLRDLHGTSDFTQWPENAGSTPEQIAALTAPGSAAWDELAFSYFVQFHLHLQLREATEYAHGKGVILKGDIPIGVYRHGADAWQAPELYHMDMQAGAPPDAFAVKGQNWSFPTYNWPRMKANGFAWWKQRFEQIGHYFDAFRIDHILGFFRIWSIPLPAVEGILGYFVPALPLRVEEFAKRGIPFDRNRFVLPFITDKVLWEMFGQEQEMVKGKFLLPAGSDRYALKPEFSTQRKVEQYFSTLEPSEANARLKEKLYDLLSNVILFEVETNSGPEYHFRFAVEGTPSFRNLDLQAQTRLKDLYIDYFYRRQDHFWMMEALQKLPALKRVTNMLVCGEDLGMVPGCVPTVMRQLGLLSLEVQRMPKAQGLEFFHPKDAPYLSVVTPSTHDMSTLRGWWTEDRRVTQRFYNQELGQPGEAPSECEPRLNQAIIEQHLVSPAMWSIFQLQDLLGINGKIRRGNPADERINVPANPNNYWCYRMHLTLEALNQNAEFNAQLGQLVRQSGR